MSLDKKKLKYFKKDEESAVEEYSMAAEMVNSEAAKKLFLLMAKDEAKHVKMLELIKHHEKEAPKEKKSKLGRLRRKSYEDEVKEHFEAEGVYEEQEAEEDE